MNSKVNVIKYISLTLNNNLTTNELFTSIHSSCLSVIKSSSLEVDNINMLLLVTSTNSMLTCKAADVKASLNIKKSCYLFDMQLENNHFETAVKNTIRVMKCGNNIKNALIIKIIQNEIYTVPTSNTINTAIVKINDIINKPVLISNDSFDEILMQNCI